MDKQIVERNLRYLVIEIFWAAIFTGCVSFNAAYMIRLGGSNLLISGVALINALATMPFAALLERSVRRKPLIVGSLAILRLGHLALIALPWLAGYQAEMMLLVLLLRKFLDKLISRYIMRARICSTQTTGGIMKFLLTSTGIKNMSIHDALVDLLGKPIAEASALCIPTAIYPFPGGPRMAYQFISGSAASPVCALGWKSLGVLELTALPSINAAYWIAAVQEVDALLVWGGDVRYLCRWMRESGLAHLLPSLRATVYVGVSAGSMVTAPVFGETYDDPTTPFVIDTGLGLVDVAVLPHLDHADHPESSTAKVERMAAEVPVPMYAIDDETAIKVIDGAVDVVSEGHWKRFVRE